MVLDDGVLRPRPIGDVVRKQQQGYVVGFDPDTFAVGYHAITGWYEGPADRIYEITLHSGRRVRVTAGHNLFTLARDGRLQKVRTGELRPGVRVAVPRRIPDPEFARTTIDLLDVIPESEYPSLVCTDPTVRDAFADGGAVLARLLRDHGYRHTDYYARPRGSRCISPRWSTACSTSWAATTASSPRARASGLPPHAARRSRVRLVPRYLRRRGIPTPPAVRGVEHRPVDPRPRRGGVARARAPDVTALRTRSRAPPRSRRACSSGSVPAARPPRSASRRWCSRGRAELLEAFLEGLVDGDGSIEDDTNIGLDDLRRAGRRPAGAVRPTRAARRHLAGATAAMRRSARSTHRRASTSC